MECSIRTPILTALCAAAVVFSACEMSKSSNPLSPSVAGPIPGVVISAPKAVQPADGAKIAVDQQPIAIVLENASTTGVRPLGYDVDIATDAAFANKVFARGGVTPGDGGRTALKLPDTLATGRTYYWRVRADDGANAGPYTTAAFTVFTPIVIDVPALVTPASNSTADSLRPRFVVADATRSGPVGALTYLIEIGDDDAFASRVASWVVPEAPTQTAFAMPTDLAYSRTYYWHVRAADPTTTGPWSRTQAFLTPAPPPPPPAPASSYAGTFAAAQFGGTVQVSAPGSTGGATFGFRALSSGASATGSVKYSGGAPVSVVGTFDTAAQTFTLTGGEFQVLARVAGGAMTGTVSSATGTALIAGFQSTSAAPVVSYCGTYQGDASGRFNIAVRGANVAGIAVDPGGTNVLSGTLSGSSLTIGWTPAGGFTGTAYGTLSGTSVSGTWSSTQGASGTWNGTSGGC